MGSVEFSVSALPNCKMTLWKGQSCLWLGTLTEMGEPFHPNNHLSLTACFSRRSSKHHPCRQSCTSLLVPEIHRPQAHLTGIKIGSWKGEVTSQSVWDDRGKEEDKATVKWHPGHFHWAHHWTNQRNTVSSNTAKVSKVLVIQRLMIFLYSLRAWESWNPLVCSRKRSNRELVFHQHLHHHHHPHHHHHHHRYYHHRHYHHHQHRYHHHTIITNLILIFHIVLCPNVPATVLVDFYAFPHLILAKTSCHWYN